MIFNSPGTEGVAAKAVVEELVIDLTFGQDVLSLSLWEGEAPACHLYITFS